MIFEACFECIMTRLNIVLKYFNSTDMIAIRYIYPAYNSEWHNCLFIKLLCIMKFKVKLWAKFSGMYTTLNIT